MPILPDYQPSQGQHRPASPSVAAASAPGRAMQALGQSISGAGDMAADVAERIQRGVDLGIKSQAGLAMQNALAEHEEFRIKNPDESLWEDDLKSRISKARSAVDLEKASSAMRAELDTTFSGWESNAVNSTRLDGLKYKMSRARTDYTRLREEHIRAGNFQEVRRMDDEAEGAGLFSPGETKANRMEADRLEEIHKDEQFLKSGVEEIDSDWVTASKKYESADPPKDWTGSASVYHTLRQHAVQAKAKGQAEIINTISDRMSQKDPVLKITSSKDIAEFEDELGPSLFAKVSRDIDEHNEARDEANRKSPGYQKQLLAIVTEKIDQVDVNDIESQYDIQRLIAKMDAGPIKNHYSEELSRRIDGTPPKNPGVTHGVNILRNAYRANFWGNSGKVEAEQTTSDAVSDDFLRDSKKMSALFSGKDAHEIVNPDLTPAARLAKFIELYPKRDTSKDNPNDYVLRAGKAIFERKEKIPRSPDEVRKAGSERLAASLSHATAEAAFLKWAADNPKDSEDPQKVNEAIIRLAGPGKRESFLDAAFQFEDAPTEQGMVLPGKDEPPLDPLDLPPPP